MAPLKSARGLPALLVVLRSILRNPLFSRSW